MTLTCRKFVLLNEVFDVIQIDLDDRENLAISSGFYEQGKQALRCGDEVAGNLGSVRRKPDPGGVQGRSDYRGVIDLEKPATLGDDCMDIVSSAVFIDYANHNGGFSDNSQHLLLENTPHVSSGEFRSIPPCHA